MIMETTHPTLSLEQQQALETILEYLPLADVKNKYFEIENWLNDILAGRTAKLPNEETPTV